MPAIRKLGCNSENPYYDPKISPIGIWLEARLDGKVLDDVVWYDLDEGCYGQYYKNEDGRGMSVRRVDRLLEITLRADAPQWAKDQWDAPQ